MTNVPEGYKEKDDRDFEAIDAKSDRDANAYCDENKTMNTPQTRDQAFFSELEIILAI